MRCGNGFIILNHALHVHSNCPAHILLYLLLRTASCYTTREVGNICAVIMVAFFDDNKETMHGSSCYLIYLLFYSPKKTKLHSTLSLSVDLSLPENTS